MVPADDAAVALLIAIVCRVSDAAPPPPPPPAPNCRLLAGITFRIPAAVVNSCPPMVMVVVAREFALPSQEE